MTGRRRAQRLAIAAAGLAAAIAAAQAEVPAPQCEPRPAYPGLKALKGEPEVKAFEAEIRRYRECIGKYIAERRAVARSHDAAASAAAEEHNQLMTRIRAEQDAARGAAAQDSSPHPSRPRKADP